MLKDSLSMFIVGLLTAAAIIGLVYDWPLLLCVFLLSAAVLLALFVFLHLRNLSESLEHYRTGIEAMTQGDFAVSFIPSDVPSSLLAELGQSLDALSDYLAYLLEGSQEQSLLQQAILDGLNEGVVSTDRRGRIKLETPLVRELLRGPAATAPGRGQENYLFLRGVSYNYIWGLMAKAMQQQKSIQEEINLSTGTETRSIEVYTAPLRLGDEVGALAVLRDVTLIKQLERMREDFVANVTHELKTPLTSIRGYVDLLRSTPRLPAEAEQFYEILDIEADRLQALINDLLELSEIQVGDYQRTRNESVVLYQVCDEVLGELAPLACERKVRLHLDVDPDLVIRANASRIKQLLTNLISNAVKYNKEGGDVWVDAAVERSTMTLRVRDSGIGIPPEHHARIFERFYRVSKSRSREVGGTGLGLAIVKHIAGLYGGTVRVESAPGEGSIFTVLLPM